MPTILTTDDDHAGDVARRLLDAAGDQPDRVKTVTAGARLAFDVDDDLARAAGFVIDDEPGATAAAKPARGKAKAATTGR